MGSHLCLLPPVWLTRNLLRCAGQKHNKDVKDVSEAVNKNNKVEELFLKGFSVISPLWLSLFSDLVWRISRPSPFLSPPCCLLRVESYYEACWRTWGGAGDPASLSSGGFPQQQQQQEQARAPSILYMCSASHAYCTEICIHLYALLKFGWEKYPEIHVTVKRRMAQLERKRERMHPSFTLHACVCVRHKSIRCSLCTRIICSAHSLACKYVIIFKHVCVLACVCAIVGAATSDIMTSRRVGELLQLES